MIRRYSDTSLFSEKEFEKIAKSIKENENKKLYKVCSDQESANLAISELKLKGYKYEIVSNNNECKIYSIFPESIDKKQAEESGMFKKIAFGRYCFQRQMTPSDKSYNFDDGSIWKVITADDGKQYLTKEVDDEDEEKIVRTKIAKLNKKAASDLVVNDSNANNLINILFENSDNFKNQILNSDKKQFIFDIIKEYYNNFLNSYLQKYNTIDQNLINSIKDEVNTQIMNGQILNMDSVKALIDAMVNNNGK